MRPSAQTHELVWRSVVIGGLAQRKSYYAGPPQKGCSGDFFKMMRKVFMSYTYVMQRANGDVFAVDNHGRLRVPLFNSGSDGLLARLRNFGMLLFKPVILDARLLKQIVPVGGAAELEFWLVDDPRSNLNGGRLLQHAQVSVLAENRVKLKAVPVSPTTIRPLSPVVTANGNSVTAAWEDAGGRYAKCA